MLYHAGSSPGSSSLVLLQKHFLWPLLRSKAFRFFNFLQKRKWERLSWFAFSSRRGTFDRGWLSCSRIDTDGFWFSPCWSGFVQRVMSILAALNRGTCRGCNYSFDELVKLAQVMNVPATLGYRPDQNIAWNEQTAIQLLFNFRLTQPQSTPFVVMAWTEILRRMALLSKIASKFNFQRSRTYPTIITDTRIRRQHFPSRKLAACIMHTTDVFIFILSKWRELAPQ